MNREEATMQTKQALASSLKNLMKTKPLSKITINEIASGCYTNRNTFYYHFDDIYGLLKWMLEQEAIEVVKKYDLLSDYEDAITFVIGYVESNSHILNCAYDSMGREEMKRFFFNDFISLVSGIVEECEQRDALSVHPGFKKFLCNFITEAIAGMLVNSFREGIPMDKKEIVDSIQIILDSLPDILTRASQDKGGH